MTSTAQVSKPPADAVSISFKQTSVKKGSVWEVTPDATGLQKSPLISSEVTTESSQTVSVDEDAVKPKATKPRDASSPKRRHGHGAAATAAAEGPIETLTYRDPFAGVYKKYGLNSSTFFITSICSLHFWDTGTFSARMDDIFLAE